MKQPKLSPRVQLALTVFGLLVVMAGSWLLLISPQRSEAARLVEEIADTRTQIETLKAQVAAAEQVEPIETADLFRLTKAMPDRTDMPGILLEINKIARDTNVEFESIVPGDELTHGAYRAIPVGLRFQGDFYALSDFLFRVRNLVSVRGGELEASGRLFTVDGLTFAPRPDKGFRKINAELTLTSYSYGAASPSPLPAAPASTATAAPGAAPGSAPAVPGTAPAVPEPAAPGTAPAAPTPTPTPTTTPPAPPGATAAPAVP